MTERREHQCQKTECDSQATVGVDLHLNLCAPGVMQHICLHCTMQVCDKHKDDVRGYVLSEQNKETIRTTLTEQGMPEPDFLSARITFVEIEQPSITVDPIVGCDRDGCVNPAKWVIVQVFRNTSGRGKTLALHTNICVCDKHRKETKPADLLRGDDRATTLRMCNRAGMLLPDLDKSVLEFVAIETGEPETLKVKERAG